MRRNCISLASQQKGAHVTLISDHNYQNHLPMSINDLGDTKRPLAPKAMTFRDFFLCARHSFEFDQKQAQRKASQMIRGCWALHSPRSSTQSAQCAMCSVCITVCIRGRSKKRCSMLLCGNSCPNLLLIWWGFFSLFLCSGYFLFGWLEGKVSNVWNVDSESESIEICHFEDELERSCATNVQIGERMKKK